MPQQFSPLLSLRFNLALAPRDIRAFRGAFARLAGREADLFHNHNNAPERPADYFSRYPVIQYRVRDHHAEVFALGAGVPALEKLVDSGKLRNFNLRGHRQSLRVIEKEAQFLDPGLTVAQNLAHRYRIRQYLPFSQTRFHEYRQLERMGERIHLLETVLCNHLVSFCYAMEVPPPPAPRIQVALTQLHRQHCKRVLNRQPYQVFDLEFRSNLRVPERVGLGRKTAFGYGVVERV